MDYSVRSVLLSEIDTTDQTFRITTTTNYADLVPSITSMGLLQPPLLVKKGPVYIVVCGFRRIAACRSIPLDRIPARIDAGQSPGIHHARIAIADNAGQRALNVVEQSRALGLVRRFMPDSADWQAVAESVGLPNNPKATDRLLQIADMPESLQTAIVNGRIAPPVAISINHLPPDDAKAVSDLYVQLNTGLNIQRELLELIGELAIIREMTIPSLLGHGDITRILTDNDTPLPQRVQHLRQVLKKMRFPELSKAEDGFHQALQALNVNASIQLQPPPFFEGKTFRLVLSVSTRRHLKSLLPDLQKIADHPHILPE